MKANATKDIRNVGLLGHGGEGKTSLAEAMLFLTGAVERYGRVEDGAATTDSDPEEVKRQISISAAVAPVEWKNHKINVVDLPGYFDFVGELSGALRAIDAAVIVMSAVSGLVVGGQKAWDACVENHLARIIFINSMDRENANFSKVLAELQDKYGASVTALQIPIMQNGVCKGLVDILANKAHEYNGKTFKEIPVPADMADELEVAREALTEAVASTDETLMEKYFGGEALTPDEIRAALRTGVMNGDVVPVLCGAAVQQTGVADLLDAIVNFLPSPADCPAVKGTDAKGNDVEFTSDAAAPFVGQVFKTLADPFVGKISLFRVVQGSITSTTPLYNSTREKDEKAGNISVIRGKKLITVDKLIAGDIGALAKLQYTMTGDTLCEHGKPVLLPEIHFPAPAISMAVSAKAQGEDDKVFAGLHRLEEEDATFRVEKNVETNDTLIQGMGELHLETIISRLKAKYNVEAVLAEPKIAYRESIRKSVKVEGRHKKQTGGHGQFGHCWIEFQPIPEGGPVFEFVDNIVGGVVPRQFIPAVEKGLREAVMRGVLSGCQVVNLRCILYDGSYHAVDSNEMSFKMAAKLAFRKGMNEANPVLLEPIYHISVTVPDDYMGDVIGDMNRRRGRIMGMSPAAGKQIVEAEVPLSEVCKYATDLRSMTQAHGSFTMEFARYEEVPPSAAAKIIEQAKKNMEEEEE